MGSSGSPGRGSPLSLPDLATGRGPVLGRDPSGLRRAWFVATTVGESAGFLLVVLTAALASDLPVGVAVPLLVAAGCLEGLALGAAQAWVLRGELLGFSRLLWSAATAAGAGAAWLVALTVNGLHPAWTGWPWWVSVPLGAVAGTVLLAAVGCAQWLVLRHHVPGSVSWIPVSALAWAVGLAACLAVVTPLWHEGQQLDAVVAVGLAGGLVMAAVVAAVTGFWLARLLRRDAAEPVAPGGVPAALWEALAGPTDRFAVFDHGLLEGLPAPVQRWLRHCITTGTTLLTGVETENVGHVRLAGSWHRYRARQRASLQQGFIWAARSTLWGLPVTGFDSYLSGRGEMCWRVSGRWRAATATGAEISRSAAGRHAAEMLATTPAAALDPAVRWRALDERRATAHVQVGGEQHAVTVTVDALGRLCGLELDRWGSPPGRPYGRYRFGVELGGEQMFDGYLVPTEVTAGWHVGVGSGDDGTFLRYRLTRCSFH